MAEPKTQPTDSDVDAFIAGVANATRRADAQQLVELMRRATGEEPVMWGRSIVGFGSYSYPTGRTTGQAAAAGFSPRSAATVIYLPDGFVGYQVELGRLGPHSTGQSCLYVKRLADVDVDVLEDLVRTSYTYVSSDNFPPGK